MMTKNEPIYTVKKESYGKNNLKYHFVCPKCNTFLDEPTVRYKTPQCLICNTRLRWPKKTNKKINTNYRLSEKTINRLSIMFISTGISLLIVSIFVILYVIK